MDLSGLSSAIESANLDSNLGRPLTAAIQQPVAKIAEPQEKPVEQKPIDTTPKKPWEKLEADTPEKKEEKPTDEKPVTEEDDVPEPPGLNKAQKDKFIAHRQKHNELKKQVPELQKQIETLKQEVEKAKTSGKPDEATLKELEDLRTYRAAADVKATPEYKQTVEQPLAEIFNNLAQIAEHAKVDPEALEAATDEQVGWKRALAIKKVFETAEEAVPQELVNAALLESEKLWPLYAEAAKMKENAQKLWQGLQNKTEVEQQKAKEEAEAKYAQHHNGIFEQLKAKAGISEILKNEDVAKALQAARPSDDPDDKAYSTLAGELLPHLTTKLKELAAENERLKKSEKALVGARPSLTSVNSNGAKRTNGDDVEMNENDLLDAVRSSGVGRR